MILIQGIFGHGIDSNEILIMRAGILACVMVLFVMRKEKSGSNVSR